MEHGQAQTTRQYYQEIERKAEILGLEFVRPLAVSLEAYHRNAPAMARSPAELQLMRQIMDLTLQTLFSPNLIQCIEIVRGAFDAQQVCVEAWLAESYLNPKDRELKIELCNYEMQGRLGDCFSEGLLKLNY